MSRTREETREYMKGWRAKNPEKQRAIERRARLKYEYGITPERYEEMLIEQDGVCLLCSALPNGLRLAIDHNHSSGKVRGLLCRSCNLVLGHVRDDPDLLRKMAYYVDESDADMLKDPYFV